MIQQGLLLQWLHFKTGNFCKTAAFKSYGLKTKQTSQYSACKLALAYRACNPPDGGIESYNWGQVSIHTLTKSLASKSQTP